ncbi:ribosome silencing factor [Maritimibacter sp. UBA3975]|uniref:ribosome silencing factor n=2 Tax=Maritimibacter TaxID=404235 RepID=UPI000C093F90|nr:ribosome silencing factor [Maritimibacter sp. UBA3975]MAM63348.1 ribosome silencing factor [Maritimibacter sp.]|tara:strand:+ start:13551 stop:14000 length:450 start_codon:yes stop_codon:yes gene_type:complete
MRRATKEDNVLSYHPEAVEVPTAGLGGMTRPPVTPSSETILDTVLSSLEDDKAEEIVTIDLRGKSAMADAMVICSGRSTRQVAAISEKLTDRLKQEMGLICKVEGKDQGDWVLIDTGDVIVHVFRPEVRDFYQLEKMWMTPEAAAPAKA